MKPLKQKRVKPVSCIMNDKIRLGGPALKSYLQESYQNDPMRIGTLHLVQGLFTERGPMVTSVRGRKPFQSAPVDILDRQYAHIARLRVEMLARYGLAARRDFCLTRRPHYYGKIMGFGFRYCFDTDESGELYVYNRGNTNLILSYAGEGWFRLCDGRPDRNKVYWTVLEPEPAELMNLIKDHLFNTLP